MAEEEGYALGKVCSRMATATFGAQVTFADQCAIRPWDIL